MPKVLVACEYSGRVRAAFQAAGCEAWSCDLLPSEDNSPYHWQGDVRAALGYSGWDLLIAHPPCTYLAASGMHWTTRGLRDPQLTEEALQFVTAIMVADCPRICVENPIGILSSRIRKPEQIVQPYWFGDDASKQTCLWLKGLPVLRPTTLVLPRLVCCGRQVPNNDRYGCPDCCGEKTPKPRWGNQLDSGQNKLGPGQDRWKERSRTYLGIAAAMAEQWAPLLFSDAQD